MNCFVILAAGFGTRMKSKIPKVLHKIGNIPMIIKLLKQIPSVSDIPYSILVVVSTSTLNPIKECMETYIDASELKNISLIIQEQPNGTGHALQSCFHTFKTYKKKTKIIVLQADCPLIKAETIRKMLEFTHIKIMTMEHKIPNTYGRIVRMDNGKVKIVESKDCDINQSLITEVNCGVYSYSLQHLLENLFRIQNDNAQKEYYITDLVELIQSHTKIPIVETYKLPITKIFELTNINDQETLKMVNDKVTIPL